MVGSAPWQFSASSFFISLVCGWVTVGLALKRSPAVLPRIAALISGLLITGLVVWAANATIRVPIDLNDTTGTAFTATLTTVSKKPDYVYLSCSAYNDAACALAEKFIPLLQRAGWKVDGPKVDRVMLGRHSTEVVISDYGPPLLEPQNPDLGVWTKLMPWRLTEQLAFNKLGINVIAVNDPSLPETRTRIYFGTSPTRSLVATLRGLLP